MSFRRILVGGNKVAAEPRLLAYSRVKTLRLGDQSVSDIHQYQYM